ncbi:hypothetical protein QRD43_17755 [Pelomonas sp. APW6]|uniref:HDOD domain-containing protein n=1 Tax=Roseateles subflavus TaxID=3053353 RepID=A0ABT7LQI9_9BURK|nr:hypothetical protein [Pelomonas sp. APW6]MDL5033761.1 hypothetical protein [Pelomonas sp. APW6]
MAPASSDAPGPAPPPEPAASVPPRIDRLVLRVAYAYDVLPFDVFQRLRSALAGDHNIAQALETAREVVAVLSADDLAYVLARLLVCTSDAID